MPNDEYFEANSGWSQMSVEEKLEWTRVFLDYPPRFLGVIGMLATQAGLAKGKPSSHSTWVHEAHVFARAGYSPLLYAYVRERTKTAERPHRPLNPCTWGFLPRALSSGMRLSVAVDLLNEHGPDALERRLRATLEP